MQLRISGNRPKVVDAILASTESSGFRMASDEFTGSLLRTLAASKPGGRMLEIGTGTGHATAWLLDGMDSRTTLLSVDNDAAAQAVARENLGTDPRLLLHTGDGGELLRVLAGRGEPYDLIFADSWPGKYTHLETALSLVKAGGFYVIDDMLPQPNWPDDHPAKVELLLDTLGARGDFQKTWIDCSTGIVIATRMR